MDVTRGYAIAMGGIVFLIALLRLLSHERVTIPASRYLTYGFLIRRHRFVGPWSGAYVAQQLIYLGVNVVCVGYPFSQLSISESGRRAGTLSLINMIIPLAGPHLGFLADLSGIPLRTFRQVHRSAGLMSLVLLLYHMLGVWISRTSFTMGQAENQFAVVVSIHIYRDGHS